MKEIRPWYRWQWHRYRTSDRTLSLTLAGHGAYRNLLDAAWERGGHLPADKSQWWRIALATSCDEYAKVAAEVEQFFVLSPDGSRYLNDTLSEEWAETTVYLEDISRKRSEAGKKGNEKRWGDRKSDSKTSQADRKSSHISSSSSSSNTKQTINYDPSLDGQVELEKFCSIYPKPERGQAMQYLFLEHVGIVRNWKSLPDDRSAIEWLCDRAKRYREICSFPVGMERWLQKEIYKQDDAAWLDGRSAAVKKPIEIPLTSPAEELRRQRGEMPQ